MTAAGGRRAWRRWLLGALGLAGALAAAMTAHAHSGGGLPNPATNVSVNFATGRVDFTYGHCQDVDDFQYRFASSGAWDSYNPTDGCYDGFTGPRSAYCTVSAITGQDYVEARIVTNQDPPHCEGDSVHSPVIAYARTTLATNRATLTTANLNGATLTVTLGSPATTLTATPAHATFGSGVGASGFELVTTPSIPGLSFTVGAVTAGSRTATLTLATGSNFVSPPTSVAVRVKAAAHSGSTALTSKALPVQTTGLWVGAVSGLVTEGGGKATFPVWLWSQPSAAVTVAVASRDTSEGTVAPSSLVFSTDNWNTAQTVTVTGVDDTLDDGDVAWQVRLDPASGDTGYNGLANVDVDVTTFGDEPSPQVQVSTTRWVSNFAGTMSLWERMSVATTSLLGVAARQRVAITFAGGTDGGAEAWYNIKVDACEWQAVTPGATGATGTCHTLKESRSGPRGTYHLTVDVTPTQAMLNHGGLVIRLGHPIGSLSLSGPAAGAGHGALMTEWVPFARPALALSPASVPEGGGVSTVTATLSRASTGAVTLTVAAAAAPPAGAGDFTLSTAHTLTIAANATTSTGAVTVTAVDNTVDAPDKSVTVWATVGGAVVSPVTLALTDDEALPTAALVLAPSSVTENGGIATVTATLSHPSSEAVTLTVATAAVSPAVAGDFSLSTATTLTLAAGATTSTGTVTVTAVDNAVVAPDKAVTVSATAAGGNGVVAPSDATLTLRDDDYGLDVGAVSGSATEAGGQATFPVALLSQPTAAVTVAVSSQDPDEGTVEPSSLTFMTGDWSTAQTVTVTGAQDTVDDGTVTWQVRLDPSSGDTDYDGLDAEDMDVTTTDDDGPPGVTLSLNPTSIAESGAGNVATVTARLSHPSGAATTVTVAAVSGAFTVGAGAAGVVVIAAGDTTSTDTATVTAVDNDTDAPDRTETVTATVTNARAAADSETMAVTGAALTLTDDDAAPGATLSLDPASIAEPSGVSTVSATLSHPSSQPSTVTVTAVSGAYTVGTDATIVIAAGATTAASDTATITAVDDDLHHGSAGRGATVTAALTNGQGAGAVTGASLTITDDETLPLLSLVLSSSSISENGGVATITASLAGLSGKSSAATTVTVAAAAVASSGAVAGDFTQTGTTLTIAAGSLTSTGLVTVTGVDNNADAANKLVRISGTTTGGHGIENPGPTVLTLTDDEATATAALVLTPPAIAESGGLSTVTATLSHPTTEAVTLTVATTAVSPAVQGDFTRTGSTLTIAAGATTSTGLVTVTANDNNDAQGSKRVRVAATASGGRGVAAPSSETLTLRDDEPGLNVGAVGGQATEGVGRATFTVALTTRPSEAVTVAVTGRDAGGDPDEGEGTVSPPSLTFTTTGWETAQTVTVTGADDDVDDGDVAWKVRLDPASGDTDYNGLTAVDVDVTTTDDEDLPVATLVLTPASISEAGGLSTVTATLSGKSSAAVTLTVGTTAVSPAVQGDFTRTGSTLTIAAGSTTSTGTVTVAAVDNSVAQGSKRVTVSATAAGGNGVAAPSDATLTLRDDEFSLAESAVSGQATEGGGQATFTVALRSPPSQAVTVAVSSQDTSEGTVDPSSLIFSTGDWSTAQTVTVTGVDDAVDDGTVTWSVRLDPASGDATFDGLANVDVAVTTTDDDTAGVEASPSAGLVTTEGGGEATFTVQLASEPLGTVVLDVASTDTGEGTVDTDAQAGAQSTLTFTAGDWSSAQTVTVAGVDDTLTDGDQGYTVTLAVDPALTADATYDALGTVSVSVVNRDDEVTADVNGDGSINANDGLLMYYAYTFEAVFRLETDLGQRVRGFLRTLRGAGSPAADDAGYKAMLDNAWGWRSADSAAGDVNGDGSISANDGLLMYYAYTFEAVFKLENDLGRRVRGFLRTLRGAGSPAADDAGYKAMLDNAWGLRGPSP